MRSCSLAFSLVLVSASMRRTRCVTVVILLGNLITLNRIVIKCILYKNIKWVVDIETKLVRV